MLSHYLSVFTLSYGRLNVEDVRLLCILLENKPKPCFRCCPCTAFKLSSVAQLFGVHETLARFLTGNYFFSSVALTAKKTKAH